MARPRKESTSLAFMANPANWPRWPFLPMVKGNDCATILDGNPHLLISYGTNLWGDGSSSLQNATWQDFEPATLLEQGWRID